MCGTCARLKHDCQYGGEFSLLDGGRISGYLPLAVSQIRLKNESQRGTASSKSAFVSLSFALAAVITHITAENLRLPDAAPHV